MSNEQVGVNPVEIKKMADGSFRLYLNGFPRGGLKKDVGIEDEDVANTIQMLIRQMNGMLREHSRIMLVLEKGFPKEMNDAEDTLKVLKKPVTVSGLAEIVLERLAVRKKLEVVPG